MPDRISQTEAQHVLGVLDGDHVNGVRPGNFIEQLIRTMCVADMHNRTKLSQAYPGYMEAVTVYKDVRGGVEQLIDLATRSS